jgi:hypothetical protein
MVRDQSAAHPSQKAAKDGAPGYNDGSGLLRRVNMACCHMST